MHYRYLALALTLFATVSCNSSAEATRKAAEVEALAVAEAKAKAAPPPMNIAAGTQLVVRTTSTLSTKTDATGAAFTATLAQPLLDGDRVIAPVGAEVEGKVVHSDLGGRVKGRAQIAVQLTSIHTANQKVVPITTQAVWRTAPGTKKKDGITVGAMSGVGAAIGAIAGGGQGAAIGAGAGAGAGTGVVLATRGAPAVIAAESMLTFTVRAPVTVN